MGKQIFLALILMLFFTYYIPTKLEQTSIKRTQFQTKQYNEIMVNATNDATQKLILATDSYSNAVMAEGKKVDYRNINLNLDAALDRFYKTLYINLNIEDVDSYQHAIKYRIPIKIAVGYAGYYVDYFKLGGTGEEWSEIHKFSDVQGDYVINFTLGDDVTITNTKNKVTKTGKRAEIASEYPNTCLKDEATFKKVKSQVINSMIQSDLEYYTKRANEIALANGWNLNFNIPYWGNRSINSIAFIAFYQGDESWGMNKMYDAFGYATSQTRNTKELYGYTVDGKKFYSDNKLTGVGTLTYFENPYEAAKRGYSPDPKYYIK